MSASDLDPLKRKKRDIPCHPKQALAEFDKAVQLAGRDPQVAENFLLDKSSDDLVAIARELGLSFGKSKPSMRSVKDAVFGRVRESLLLSRRNTQRDSAT